MDRPEDSLYVRTLLWTYNREGDEFTMKELQEGLKISDKEKTWIERVFVEGENKLIWHRSNTDTSFLYYLTSTGYGAAVDYLELKEAQESGKRATIYSILAIAIGATVGLAQIYFLLYPSHIEAWREAIAGLAQP